MSQSRLIKTFIFLCLYGLGIGAANAQNDPWKYKFYLYGWLSDISGDITAHGATVPFDVKFEDIVEDVDSALQIHLEGSNGRWGWIADLNATSVQKSRTTPPLAFDQDLTFVELAVTHRLGEYFEVLGGARYYNVETILSSGGVRVVDSDKDLVDGFAGVRVIFPFSQAWSGIFRADIGAGGTELAVNALIGVNAQISKSFGLHVGYRSLDLEIDSGSGLGRTDLDIAFTGPILGLSISWPN